MSYGHLHMGLLKAIVDVVRAGDPRRPFSTIDVTEQLLRQNWWGRRLPKTPERTVNSYCSQNTDVFDHVGPDMYRLKQHLWQ